jgi:hypothetical protein
MLHTSGTYAHALAHAHSRLNSNAGVEESIVSSRSIVESILLLDLNILCQAHLAAFIHVSRVSESENLKSGGTRVLAIEEGWKLYNYV